MKKLNIVLNSIWWDIAPSVRIYLNNEKLFDDKVEQTKNLEYKFQNLNSPNTTLCIELFGKTIDQTQVDSDNHIVKDQLLKIESIAIDDIDLGILIFTKGIFYPEYPPHLLDQNLPTAIEKIDTFGFNGRWMFEFDIPFQIWYLENLP